MRNIDLSQAPLGKSATYHSHYKRDLLFTLPRKTKREEIGIAGTLPFQGNDIWNGFELSWLNTKGKPVVAMAEFIIPCESPRLIESKSFKLYLNSFNNTQFDSYATVENLLVRDLSEAAGASITVTLLPLSHAPALLQRQFEGVSLDEQDIICDRYTPEPRYLKTDNETVTETLYSDLLKSNCLVTGQPDWASLQITYTGKKINHAGLLQYIVSFRDHNEFHEQCVERIFVDISTYCRPERLLVYARYTRRGGLDINPYRANYPIHLKNIRLCRQ
ncbi:NADPH-dependent 7-cyano-7-deazaguanine reductase QueF [Aquicella lusitana]|uniref:NADPH-dependent 7-cyano-7-deazaguanine reductase n=1 Tax=Aquicella lusitana TaxID=254246 RepID=A0A370GX73_9COXI|nr:NADPH-dependent 7-cyano-7-deazaguanine reductase QueF [Aquicella lusitana]RDI46513.1 7-cyano-7-deazaguanine reductase [Aquicella lusitana]VVC74177.1 NADPH-dependent 7-cyano-7-deazaguanine reductase [Aquicella lusitana]